jgi:hypothetical protein
MVRSITRPAQIPQPDDERAAVEGATHGARGEVPPAAAGLGRAHRLEGKRVRVAVNLSPDLLPELDRRALEYGYSRSMYLQRIISVHFEALRAEEIAEANAREQFEKARAAAEKKRTARSIAAKKARRARGR